MSGSIFHIMGMGSESLSNSRMGVDVTGHNIANAHTAGFSRQKINVSAKDPTRVGNQIFGNGARVDGIVRTHDRYIENQLRNEIQISSEKEATTKGLERLEGIFNTELNATVRDRFTSFFNSMRELANYPEEPSSRTHVVESAINLSQAINTAHRSVVQIQDDINDEIVSELSVLNNKLDEVATLNQQILELRTQHANPGDLEDRRDAAVKEIAGLVDTQSYENEQGMLCVRGPGGSLLVEGNHAARVDLTQAGPHKPPRVLVRDLAGQGVTDQTSMITKGRVGGLVRIRDGSAQGIRDELNQMAKSFGDAFNEVHQQGYGGHGYENVKGRDFFEGLDNNEGEFASSFSVASAIAADPMSVAGAITPDSPGDNVIFNELVKLQSRAIMDDGKSTLGGAYDRFVGKLGVETLRAKEELDASRIVQSQLQSQRESVSGVSLDEEAQNLLKYQQLFQASSKIITTADELMQTILELKR